MPRALTSTLTAAALAVTGLALAGAPTSAATPDDTPGYSLQAITVDVKVGPFDDQSCRVDADLYLPDGASATKKVPAILTTHGFGGDKADSNQTAIGKGFVRQGYAVLSYSGLGFGKTDCKITLDDPDWDGKAGRQMVDVLAGKRPYLAEGSTTPQTLKVISTQTAGDPRVGMIGGSYGGQIQYAVAMQDPRVDAIVPIITWNDLTYSLAPGNVAKKEWIDLFFGDGIDLRCPERHGRPRDPALLPELRRPGLPRRDRAEHPGLPRRRHERAGQARVGRELRQADQDADPAGAGPEGHAVQPQRGGRHLPVPAGAGDAGQDGLAVVGPLRLDPVPGELDFGASSLRDSYLGNRFLSWMDHYVKGVSSATTGPQFEYFRDWVKYDTSAAKAGTAIGAAYAKSTTVSWDPTNTLYFSGGHELKATKAAAESSSASYANASAAPTSYSETSGLEGGQVNNEPTDAPGTFVSFTSDPLSAPADVVGSPKVTLKLSTPDRRLHPDRRALGPAGAVRQDLRHRTGRLEGAQEPADRADAGA